MEIGAKLRQARLASGLSQRQLCGDVITRNMLSQIENGSARPSMDTLVYLAGRLNRPVSFFLDEPAHADCMQLAREAYVQRDFSKAWELLQDYQAPNEEYYFLQTLVLLAQAEQELHRPPYARQLLEQAGETARRTCYATAELEQRRLCLLSQVSREPVALPADDAPLLCRAQNALHRGDGHRCSVLLEACEDRESSRWHYLRAEAAFQMQDYALASTHYRQAEQEYLAECLPKLEKCYQAMGDYKKAYEYACKQRESSFLFQAENV